MSSPHSKYCTDELRHYRWLILECGKLLDASVDLMQSSDTRGIENGHQRLWAIESAYDKLLPWIDEVVEFEENVT